MGHKTVLGWELVPGPAPEQHMQRQSEQWLRTCSRRSPSSCLPCWGSDLRATPCPATMAQGPQI